jgi:hypothetical protein
MKWFLFAILCMLAPVAIAQAIERYDVLIHEVFADPEPSVGLPSSSFIELRNMSGHALSLRGWVLEVGKNAIRIAADQKIGPDSLLILCSSAAAPAYRAFGSVLPLTGFPALPDAGTLIALYAPDHRTIHAMEYSLACYHNGLKSQGGWSLEMIDAAHPCLGLENWTASRDPMGGTPGSRNAVEGTVVPDGPPHARRTWVRDSLHIVVVFDRTMDSNSAVIHDRYSLSDGPPIQSAKPLPPLFNNVELTMAAPLKSGSIHELSLRDVTDCSGDVAVPQIPLRTGLPADPKPGELAINEVLFNPVPDGTDYVELLNAGRSIIDASSLYIAGRDRQGALRLPVACAPGPFLIFPGDHYVLSGDPDAVLRNFLVKEPELLSAAVNMPSLPDAEGIVVVTDRQGTTLDELHYFERWHFPLITDPEGVSLERIDPHAPTQDPKNWYSAAADIGHGTPTWRNSQSRALDSLDRIWEVAPATFSPDMDGHDDFLTLRYHFPDAGWTSTVTVFDISGRPVRSLCRNQRCGTTGYLRWDGLDDSGRHPGYGPYIVVAECFNLQGRKDTLRKKVVVAGTVR